METLGIFGPSLAESKETGVANYIALSLPFLEQYFDCTVVSRNNLVSPRSFDRVLYHITASEHSFHAHVALRERPGPAIIHEHNCLQLYYDLWHKLSHKDQETLLSLFAQELGSDIPTLAAAQAYADNLTKADRYSIDIGSEVLFMNYVTIAITHSPHIRSLLSHRYPHTRVECVHHMAKPFTTQQRKWAREQLGLQPSVFLFGTFGRIGEYKRVEQIVRAWKQWDNKPPVAHLLILGLRQYDIQIPSLKSLTYLDYVSSESEFDSYIAATDCGIQLRHPTLGETSGVITKMVANSRPVILSQTPYYDHYQGIAPIFQVAPDKNEVRQLIAAFRSVLNQKRRPLRFRAEYHPKHCVERIVRVIKSGN